VVAFYFPQKIPELWLPVPLEIGKANVSPNHKTNRKPNRENNPKNNQYNGHSHDAVGP
jgi:hypothetical protein